MLIKGTIEYASEHFSVEINELALAVEFISNWNKQAKPTTRELGFYLEDQAMEIAENGSSVWDLEIDEIEVQTRFSRELLEELLAKAQEELGRPVVRIHKDQLTLGIE